MEPRRLYVNIGDRTIASGNPLEAGASNSLAVFNEDVESVELYFYRPTEGANTEPQFVDYSANTVKLAIGITAPAALQTSWTAASTSSTATITSLQLGGVSASAIQQVSFSPPPQTGSFSISFPSRTFSVASITASTFFTSAPHGLVSNQPIKLTGFTTPTGFSNDDIVFVKLPTRQTFSVGTSPAGGPLTVDAAAAGSVETEPLKTPLISATADQAAIQRAVNSAGLTSDGSPQIIVDGSARNFRLRYAGAVANINMPVVTVTENTAAIYPYLQANLSLNTTEVAALVAAGQGESCLLEIEVTADGLRQTFQAPATISEDIITSSSPIPAPLGGTVNTLNFDDGAGGTWAVSVDANGILTATKV
jgi:hypothetical protein